MNELLSFFLRYLKEEKNYSALTLTNYEIDINQFILFLDEYYDKEILPKQINKLHIRKFLQKLIHNKLSKRSISRKLSSIRSFFNYLMISEEIQKNPATLINNPKLDKRLPKFVQEADMQELLENHEVKDFISSRDLAILELFYSSGIRLSELIPLKLNDFNFPQSTVKVTGKGSKDRIIPISDKSIKIVQIYTTFRDKLPNIQSNNLFLTERGNNIYPVMVQRLVKKMMIDINTNGKVSPHILRHSYATHMLDHGADLRAIKDLLGHENLSTTQVYTHVSKEKLKSSYKLAHPRAKIKEL
jgi:integrase/recombinase XerC